MMEPRTFDKKFRRSQELSELYRQNAEKRDTLFSKVATLLARGKVLLRSLIESGGDTKKVLASIEHLRSTQKDLGDEFQRLHDEDKVIMDELGPLMEELEKECADH